LGTMSAWYLFSALGLYPAVPGSGQFLLHAPRFSSAEIALGNGRTLRLQAPGADGRRLQYIQGVQVDGTPQHAVWLDWARLRAGGTIRYTLSAQAPERGWGTDVADLPASWCATPGSAMQ
ncbi:MAG: glycoside hydrolase family 92 protein, partial [Stenotrophomonas acidaminiphila]|nr:glycoside hydrolase family 92 protein [Stenotrophomonas acidaminiphila]